MTPDIAPVEADGPLVHLVAAQPGDLVYVPMASVVVEKALNADSIAWRVPVGTLGTASIMRSFLMLQEMLHETARGLAVGLLHTALTCLTRCLFSVVFLWCPRACVAHGYPTQAQLMSVENAYFK